MTQYGFYFDSTRCTGCRTCEMACKDYNDLPASCSRVRLRGRRLEGDGDGTFEPTSWAYHVSMSCNHCEMPACVANCPQGALEKDADTGLVSRDEEKCIGCGTCVKSCPYEVPVVDTETMKSMKCDGCAARVAEGKMPICVDACPLRALEFGDIEELRTAHPDAVDGIAPMASPDQTKPSVAILACPAAKDCGDAIHGERLRAIPSPPYKRRPASDYVEHSAGACR